MSIAELFSYLLVDHTKPLSKQGPLIAIGWEEALRNHPDIQYKVTNLDIIKFGVEIKYNGPKQRILSLNFPTAKDAPEVFTMDLETQLAYNCVTRLDAILEWFISSLLGLVPKSNEKWSCIHHYHTLMAS